MTIETLTAQVLALPEGDELFFFGYIVCRFDPCCWKVHWPGTDPDATGEFLDSHDEVRAWVQEVLR